MTTTNQSVSDFMAKKPGIHRGVPAETYHALDACSNSRLMKLRRSGEHLQESIQHPARTDAMVLGDVAHLFILQPDLVDQRYVVPGLCCARKKDGEACSNEGKFEHGDQWFCGVHRPKCDLIGSARGVLTSENRDACIGMREAVLRNPRTRDLIETADEHELSILWHDEDTDLLCKARLDIWHKDLKTIGDVKTTADARRKAFERKIYGFGYNFQMAMYQDGAAANGMEVRNSLLIPVEKTAPYSTKIYRLKDDVIEASRPILRGLMRDYAACIDSGNWPGYATDVEDIAIPEWDWRELVEGDE